VFVDTGAFYSLLDRSDAFHEDTTRCLKQFAKEKVSLVTSNFIIGESHALILTRLGPAQGRSFLKTILQGRVAIERVSEADEERAREIIFKQKDKTYTYTDATSFAMMERLEIRKAFAFDRHFVQYGFQTLPAAFHQGKARS